MANYEAPISEPPPENGLVRLYIGPGRISGKIHWVNPPYGQGLLCMPNVPVGRFHAMPDAVTATCARCQRVKHYREARVNA